MSIKPVLYFPRDLSYKWKAMVRNGPSQQHKRRFEASTHCTTQSIGWFLGGGQMGLTIPSGFDFHLFIVCSFNSQRVDLCHITFQNWRPQTHLKTLKRFWAWLVKGLWLPPLPSCLPHTPTPASAALGVSSQHDANSGSSGQPGEWTGDNRKLQRWEYILIFLKMGISFWQAN